MVLTYNGSCFKVKPIGTVFVLCAGLLTACHKTPPSPPPAAATAARPAAAVVPAQSLPARQPGLWSITISEDNSPDAPQVQQLCMDAVTDVNLGVLPNELTGNLCKETVSRTADGGWGLIAECQRGSAGVYEYSGQISGDYSRDYSEKVRLQVSGAALPQMNHIAHYRVQAKRTGDCTADQSPGDLLTEGTKSNLFDLAGLQHPGGNAKAHASAAPEAGGD
jgi:hypothetical protein